MNCTLDVPKNNNKAVGFEKSEHVVLCVFIIQGMLAFNVLLQSSFNCCDLQFTGNAVPFI